MHLLLFWLFICLIALDQVTKWIVFNKHLYFRFGVVGIEEFKNYFFAFSLPVPVVAMYSVYLVAIGAITVYIFRTWKEIKTLELFAWYCILAGAISNIAERVYFGFVKDFIKVHTGYINLADVYILFGVLCILLMSSRRGSHIFLK